MVAAVLAEIVNTVDVVAVSAGVIIVSESAEVEPASVVIISA